MFCYKSDGEMYFRLKDVARGLGFTHIANNGNEYVRWYRVRKYLSLDYNPEFITKEQLKKLIQSTNRPISREWYTLAGLNTCDVILSKEQETISFIENCYKGITAVYKQYQVGGFKIDLYFESYKLAVECDEFNHSDRDSEYEEERQEYIEKELGCTFIRFNPDKENFSLSDVINKINKTILSRER